MDEHALAKRWIRATAALVVAALGAWTFAPLRARAEILEVRQVAGGMECPECARGLRLLVREIPGVNDAETSWNRRVLSVRFKAGNHATLAQVRAAVIHQHFQAREAELVVAGRWTVDSAGQLWLSVPETGARYRIDLTGRGAEWRRALSAFRGQEVVATGRVPGAADGGDPLILSPITVRLRRPGA
jgi:hypothetical protein